MSEIGYIKTFVSRPDIFAPVFEVNVHNATALGSGYWLYAPTYDSTEGRISGERLLPTGPYIFDTNGELAWSGAPLQEWEYVNDFKYHPWGEFSLLSGGTLKTSAPGGAQPVLLDSSLQSAVKVTLPDSVPAVNPHELQLTSNGRSIVIERSVPSSDPEDRGFSMIEDHVYEIDRWSGDILFSWNSRVHIPPPPPHVVDLEGFGEVTEVHYLRINSVDKSVEGDYLVSGRGTNTIYLISGQNGSVLWRLGGDFSSFKLQGFNFSAQHDARFLQSNDPEITVVSFLDNASDGYKDTSSTSSGLVVAINHSDRSASLLFRFERPDGRLTDRRGNVQALQDGNFLVCWSESGYITEFDGEGRSIMDAHFKDKTLITYRAYKVPSCALDAIAPAEMPTIKAFVEEHNTQSSRRAFVLSAFVSWNGGFGVSKWQFFACFSTPEPRNHDGTASAKDDSCGNQWESLTTIAKQGFETEMSYTTQRKIQALYGEALDAQGSSLGRSSNAVLTPVEGPISEDGLSEEVALGSDRIAPDIVDDAIREPVKLKAVAPLTLADWITWTILLWCVILASASLVCCFGNLFYQ